MFHFGWYVFAVYRWLIDLGQGERNSELWYDVEEVFLIYLLLRFSSCVCFFFLCSLDMLRWWASLFVDLLNISQKNWMRMNAFTKQNVCFDNHMVIKYYKSDDVSIINMIQRHNASHSFSFSLLPLLKIYHTEAVLNFCKSQCLVN